MEYRSENMIMQRIIDNTQTSIEEQITAQDTVDLSTSRHWAANVPWETMPGIHHLVDW